MMQVRADGWPLCPQCGDDELYCLAIPACICADMACYACDWRGDPRTTPVHHCDGGWICEEHPDKPWPHRLKHGECGAPGMPCRDEQCKNWPQRWAMMDGSGRNWVVER